MGLPPPGLAVWVQTAGRDALYQVAVAPLCRQPLTRACSCPPPLSPVSCLAFTCHFNLVPVQCSLKDPSSGHMLRVLQLALAVCVLVYATVAVCGAWWQGGFLGWGRVCICRCFCLRDMPQEGCKQPQYRR